MNLKCHDEACAILVFVSGTLFNFNVNMIQYCSARITDVLCLVQALKINTFDNIADI